MKILAANWKMYLDLQQSIELTKNIVAACETTNNSQIFIAPSNSYLSQVSALIGNNKNIKIGSQNVHWEEHGAFTGELSPKTLKEFNCHFAIIGHSERRHIFGESPEVVHKRLLGALKYNLTAIYCIGETLNERESSNTFKIIDSQLKIIKENNLQNSDKIIIAYEPVWAIGTGKAATTKEITEAHNYIKNFLISDTKILYGGSTTPDNLEEILAIPSVDGALVGGASVDKNKFIKMIKSRSASLAEV